MERHASTFVKRDACPRPTEGRRQDPARACGWRGTGQGAWRRQCPADCRERPHMTRAPRGRWYHRWRRRRSAMSGFQFNKFLKCIRIYTRLSHSRTVSRRKRHGLGVVPRPSQDRTSRERTHDGGPSTPGGQSTQILSLPRSATFSTPYRNVTRKLYFAYERSSATNPVPTRTCGCECFKVTCPPTKTETALSVLMAGSVSVSGSIH